MDRYQDRSFTPEEVGELIEAATRLQQVASDDSTISFQRLARIAAELGIEDSALLEAVARRLEARDAIEHEKAAATKRLRRRRKAWRGWRGHLASYIGVISGLALLDFATSPSNWPNWFFYPAAGWGIGLLVHTFTLLFRAED